MKSTWYEWLKAEKIARKEWVQEAIVACGGNKSEAARRLEMDRSQIDRILEAV